MPIPKGLVKGVASELKNLFQDTLENVSSGNPAYLESGQPESFIGTLNQATARQACRKWANKAVGQNPGNDQGWDKLCKPYLESIGEYPGTPEYGAPFTGLQCTFTYSEIRWQSIARGNSSGPVQGLNPVFASISNVQGPVRSVSFQNLGELNSFVRIVDGNGNTRDSDTNNFVYTGWTLFSTTPADTCGDPPADYKPPQAPGLPVPPMPVTPGPGFNVDIDVEFNPDGTVTVTIDPGGGGDTSAPVDPSSPAPGTEPGDGGQPDSPVDTGSGGEAEGSDEDRVLVGVRTNFLQIPPNARSSAGPQADLYRGSQYVYLGVPGQLDLQPEGAIATDGQFYFAPEGSNTWRVAATNGYNIRVTPYYKAP